jgi:hypothetical protein
MVQTPEVEAKKARKHYYYTGFKKGAGNSWPDPEQSLRSVTEDFAKDYRRGYEDGRKAAGEAVRKFCEEIGHDPTTDILR